MDRIEILEKQVRELTATELAEFRRWFSEFDAELWDRQFEADVKDGKLDAAAEKALRAHAAASEEKIWAHSSVG